MDLSGLRQFSCYCERTSRGGDNGLGPRTMMFEGPGGGILIGFDIVSGWSSRARSTMPGSGSCAARLANN
jgi:hypothetical protein